MLPNDPKLLARSRLSYWFPTALDVIGWQHTPSTTLVRPHSECDLTAILDGIIPPHLDSFENLLVVAARGYGFPVFLRSDLFAGKHAYRRSCRVERTQDLVPHVFEIVEDFCAFGDCTGFDCWAVREFLTIKDPIFEAFEGLPIGREVRVRVDERDDRMSVITHPYWPVKAVMPTARKDGLRLLPSEVAACMAPLAEPSAADVDFVAPRSMVLAERLGGSWAVDWMETAERGWVMIDACPLQLAWTPSADDVEDWMALPDVRPGPLTNELMIPF